MAGSLAEIEWVRIDTHIGTCQHRIMAARVKRTYNLSSSTVRRVREMAERTAWRRRRTR